MTENMKSVQMDDMKGCYTEAKVESNGTKGATEERTSWEMNYLRQ